MADEDKKQKTDHGHGHSHDHADGHKPAEIVSLGAVTLGGTTYIIDREGQVESGKVTEFGVEVVGGTPVTPTAAWLANPDGTEVCDPVKGEGHDLHWHFNVEPLMPVKKSKFMLKVGDEVAAVDWAKGAAPCNDGAHEQRRRRRRRRCRWRWAHAPNARRVHQRVGRSEPLVAGDVAASAARAQVDGVSIRELPFWERERQREWVCSAARATGHRRLPRHRTGAAAPALFLL